MLTPNSPAPPAHPPHAAALAALPAHPPPPVAPPSPPQTWIIRSLNLAEPLPDLTPIPAQQGLYLVVWWHEIPLGHLELPAWQLPLSARDLYRHILPVITPTVGSYLLPAGFRAPLPGAFGDWYQEQTVDFATLMAVRQPLQQLWQDWQTRVAAQAAMSLSVIICTRDRPTSLARCLRSLQTLVNPPTEILVVDNAPTSPATAQLVAEFPGIRYLQEPQPGLSMARNAGLRAATGSLIAFTDDDVEVHPHWVAHLRAAFCQPEVMAVTGLIIPAKLETEAEQVFQLGSTGFGWGYRPLRFDRHFFAEMKPFGVPVWRIGAGANMAFRRQIFDEVGMFDPRLGAGAAGCSEDSEFWYRVLAAGWVCCYEPAAVVYHHHRADLSSLNQQMYAYMRGHVAALLVQAEMPGHWGNLRRLFVALPRYYAKRLILGCLHRFQGVYRTVLAEISGCFQGVIFYLGQRRPLRHLKGCISRVRPSP